ncbi:hypothetical protein MWMV17_MWMV17_01096 [Acinetobacter calcoaceticus]|uniref:hypothetical protein n=1 Tax=Acinetobacter calcoaceticus TaxID=471 RepID=UPI0002D6A868|nr:hypothetical protein [Acinetobacter calcoaceticus]CAI3118940.1 hypothetical protein MWMV17_MWMV17_01096 [Acinetobacter calcoaceticus]SUU53938.1 Uncharacterised protein [Acinetobacter calcoaceticus]
MVYNFFVESEAMPKHGKNFNDATRVQHITPISAGSLTGSYTFIELLVNSSDGVMRRILIPLATILKEESNINSEVVAMKAQQIQHSGDVSQNIFLAVMIFIMIIVLLISPFSIETLLSCFVTISCLADDLVKCYNKSAVSYLKNCTQVESEAMPKHGKNFNDATRVQHITPISAGSLTGSYTFIEKLVNSSDGVMRRITSYLYG